MSSALPIFDINNNPYFNILYAGEGVKEGRVKPTIYLMADRHDNGRYAFVNTYFINEQARAGDTVLLESAFKLQAVDLSTIRLGVRLHTPAKVLGWDIGAPQVFAPCVPPSISASLAAIESVVCKYPFLTPADQVEAHKSMKEIVKKAVAIAKSVDYSNFNPLNKFSERTTAMIESLDEAIKTGGSVFLIAGNFHLLLPRNFPFFEALISEGSCASDVLRLHAFLSKTPYVIVTPKPNYTSPIYEAEQKFRIEVQDMLNACQGEASV